MKKKKYLFTSSLLAISLLLTNITAYAEDNAQTSNETGITEEDIAQADRDLMKDLLPGDLSLVELSDKELDDYEIPEVVSKKDIIQNRNVNRLFAQETDDYSIVFQNKDGSKTMYCFNEPVKYIDENGTVCDKSTKLSETDKDGYAFVSADNDINVYMPEQLDSETGIIVKSGEYTIEMSPIDATEADVSEIITKTANKYDEHDIVEYNGAFGADTTIEYSAQLNGVKENIILDRYNGKNEFSFDVDTNGLILRDEDGYFSIIDDEKNEVVGTVSEVILFDSSNGENTIVPQGYVTGYTAVRNDDDNYTITIKLDEKWLAEEAVYPVVIDPNLKIATSGTGSSKTIFDAPVYSKKSTTNFGSYAIATVGYQDTTYGAGRLAVRFPGLENNSTYKSLKANEIESVKLYMYEGTGNSGTSTLRVRYSNLSSGWAETTPTYSNTSASGSVVSSTSISKSGTYTFDFTTLAIAGKNSKYDLKKGIVITNTNQTDTSLRRSFFMTEYSSSKPRVVVQWNPVIDGMAYVFKTDNTSCLTANNDNYIEEGDITTYGNNIKKFNSGQIWIVKKSIASGYLIYNIPTNENTTMKAIYQIPSGGVNVSECSSEANPYYCWKFERVNNTQFAIKNVYSKGWLYVMSNDRIGTTTDESKRTLFKKAINESVVHEGGYTGQKGTYRLNLIFDNSTDYSNLASSVENWNGICDNITVKSYPPNANPSYGLNVHVARLEMSTSGLQNISSTYAKFIPNSTTTNYLKVDYDIRIEMNNSFNNGVIFLNTDSERFFSLSLSQQKTAITHEVGHALKIFHTDVKSDGTTETLFAYSIMRANISDQSPSITAYDKSVLIKKWRDMP